MAGDSDNEDRTEEATPERREEFREKGQIAISREVSSVFVLAAVVGMFSFYLIKVVKQLEVMMTKSFSQIDLSKLNEKTILDYLFGVGG